MTRLHTITQKIPREKTGLRGSFFVHVDFDDKERAVGVRFSTKWKDNSVMDDVLTALGDALTDIIKERAAL